MSRPLPALLLLLAAALLAAGCASEGSGAGGNRATLPSGAPRLLVMTLTVNQNGRIQTSGQGYYVILINAQGTAIEVTDIDTFTDFIRFDGRSTNWFHRQGNAPNPGFTFVNVGTLDSASTVSPDGRSLEIVLDAGEPTSFLNQFVATNTFTAHVLTSDSFQGAVIGRAIDTLGQGPNLDGNSLQTVLVRKGQGAVAPLPGFFPNDALNDFVTHAGLPADFPYEGFDVATFQIVAR